MDRMYVTTQKELLVIPEFMEDIQVFPVPMISEVREYDSSTTELVMVDGSSRIIDCPYSKMSSLLSCDSSTLFVKVTSTIRLNRNHVQGYCYIAELEVTRVFLSTSSKAGGDTMDIPISLSEFDSLMGVN